MRDFISILIYGFLIFGIFTLFVNLLPFLLPIVIVMMVVSYFRRQKRMQEFHRHFEQNTYEEPTQSQYQTRGDIKADVIDVEYKETVEK